jgi:hypothetical protein
VADVLGIINTTVSDIVPFIRAANIVVTRHLSNVGMDSTELKEIERWLSAHFIAIRDPRLRERTVGDARDKYAISGGYSGGLDATPYGQQVMVLDYTGTLSARVGKRAVMVDAVQEDYS